MPKYATFSNQFYRFLWSVCSLFLFRLSFRPLHAWRRLVLNSFGANLHPSARVYPTTVIYDPRKLTMGPNSCLADHVICYNVDHVHISSGSTISQYTHLCTAGHDITAADFPLKSAPIFVGSDVWVCANCFISPGAVLANNSVLLPCSCLVKSTFPHSIFAGVPATLKKYL